MSVPAEFKEMILNDIKRIDDIVERDVSHAELIKFHREIDSKYSGCIVKWHNGLSLWSPSHDVVVLFSEKDCSKETVIENLLLFKAKLETYQYGMNAIEPQQHSQTTVNVTNNISQEVSFENVCSRVEDMNSLSLEETKEVISRIRDLETIVNAQSSKKEKWEQIRPIVKWLADKSFDVAMMIFPLILKLKQ